MNEVRSNRVKPVVEAFAGELACVRAMLLRYELAVTPLFSQSNVSHQDLQGFDLALQILKDLEHLSSALATYLPTDAMTLHPLEASGLTLERTQRMLNGSIGLGEEQSSPAPLNTVDLF